MTRGAATNVTTTGDRFQPRQSRHGDAPCWADNCVDDISSVQPSEQASTSAVITTTNRHARNAASLPRIDRVYLRRTSAILQDLAAEARPSLLLYTRLVGTWGRRLTSLAMICVLSGTPAVIAVCAVLCLEVDGTSHTFANGAHGDHRAPAQPEASAHAQHDVAIQDHSQHVMESSDVSLADRSGATIGGPETCCQNVPVALVPGTRAEDNVTKAVTAVPAAAVVAGARVDVVGVRSPSPPVSPPSPTAAPLVLRI